MKAVIRQQRDLCWTFNGEFTLDARTTTLDLEGSYVPHKAADAFPSSACPARRSDQSELPCVTNLLPQSFHDQADQTIRGGIR